MEIVFIARLTLMKNILVIADPYNNEQIAYSTALKLASYSSARVHVAAFCYESINTDTQSGEGSLKEKLIQYQLQWWDKYIQQTSSETEVSCEVVWEKYLHVWVLNHCKEEHYDLVVKTGHRSESPFHTPTDWQLFRDSTVPIYSVYEEAHKSKKNVLVALDILTDNQDKQDMNRRLLEEAFRFSVLTCATLHCCYAIKITAIVKELELIDVASHAHQQEDAARIRFKELMDEYDIKDENLHIKEGTPWKVVASLSRKLAAECVVVGSLGRKGIPGKLIGNTSEKVIQHAKTDLLVLS
jgi:universal stress protein E